MAANTFAKIVQRWVEQSFPSWAPYVEDREDGEFEVAFPAPKDSKAGHLRIFTFRGDLWVRYNPPRMCYPIDNRAELLSIVRQLLKDKVLFVNTYRRKKWVGGTLTRRGVAPRVEPGEFAQVVSWSGKYDAILGKTAPRNNQLAG
jgi:hypothetical protein